MKLSHVLEELVEERGLNKEVLTSIICQGLHAAYAKRYPDIELSVEYEKRAGEAHVFAHKTVVATVEDEDREISLRKARSIEEKAQLGDIVKVPFEAPIGRIEILRAKQVIAQQIRGIEAKAIYEEFKPKEGTIVTGSVYKVEISGVSVKIGEAVAFLPKSLMIPGDNYTPGYAVRALLKEVLLEPRNDNQLILDRRSAQFLVELFKLEIPEVYDNIVEIKKVVRTAGYKAKVVVISHDPDVDPVGTCIGFGGARIKPILRELGTEKVDIIGEAFSAEDLVKVALKPAVIRRVEIVDSVARVWLDADQRSLAIGKAGQNIALASELCGLEIQLMEDVPPQVALREAVVASELAAAREDEDAENSRADKAE